MEKYNNIYYFNTISRIGGIETFFYQLAKKYYKTHDLTIIYSKADEEQLKRLKKYVRCVEYKGQKIKCKKAFFNFNLDIIDNVEAEEYCLVIHGDYKFLKGTPPYNPKITCFYGVSNTVCKSYNELTKKLCKTVYNPLEIDKPKKLIKLCSACRLEDSVKGGNRTQKLVEALDKYCEKNGVNYIWTIFTNDTTKVRSKNVCYMQPRLDILPYLNEADYVVQLSDNFEGYNYTVNEALSIGKPVIITPCEVYKELGINNEMSISLYFDLSNINEVVEDIFKKAGKFKFEYKAPEDTWGEILKKGESKYQEEMKRKWKVKCILKDGYDDIELKKHIKLNDEYIVTNERMEYLLENKAIEVIEQVKEKENANSNKKGK